jgi:hypothetical protein
MSNMIIKEQYIPKNWNKIHKQRLNDILTGIKPHFEKINADHLCNVENASYVLKIAGRLGAIHRQIHVDWEKDEVLKGFNSPIKWQLLHIVNEESTKGNPVYKEKLLKHPDIKVSATTLFKAIDDLLEEGLFIDLEAFKDQYKKKKDNRSINLRPSVAVVVAYIKLNVEFLLNTLDMIKEHTKVKIEFN